MLPNGAMIIDTPGMRELGMWNTEKGISETFKDIKELTNSEQYLKNKHDKFKEISKINKHKKK